MKTRCGFIAVVGLPNAGKSTFVNAVVGTKVSIVSRKPQTTRGPLRGIALWKNAQFIFVDTPGIFDGSRKFDKAMSSSAYMATGDADCVVIIIDALFFRKDPEQHYKYFKSILSKSPHTVLVLNKIDRVTDKKELLPLVKQLQEHLHPDAIFMASALKKKNLEDVLEYLEKQIPEGPWLYPQDQSSDQSENFLASEITRQHLIDRLGDEIPFQIHVTPTKWEECINGDVKVWHTIHVARPAHKKIIVGAGGSKLKAVGIHARKEISLLLGRKVHLFLEVKVNPKWVDDPYTFESFGLEYQGK